MDSSVEFWNRTAERYARRTIADQEAYQRKLALTRSFLGPEIDVLEFGCGTGSTALLHAPYVNRYLAIDTSSKMIEIARSKWVSEPVEQLTFEVATLDSLKGKPRQFDVVLGLNVLHLVPDPVTTIQEIFGLLKSGGVFISSTVCMKDTRPCLKPVAAAAHFLGITPFVHFLSRESLELSHRYAGFSLVYRWVPESSLDTYFLIAIKR